MLIDKPYVYITSLLPFCIIWILIFIKRKDLRQEMLFMSTLMGVLSLMTSYYWWTVDWWRPETITGTKVGIEDLIMGFTTGGITATIYETVFMRGLYKRKLHHHVSGAITILFLLSQTTMWLFYGVGLTSFLSSAIAMILTSAIMMIIRKDLIIASILSGILMMLTSSLMYIVILMISPQWIDQTYLYGLSGIKFMKVPIEEFIFWFLSGLVFGPFYEYWQGEKLKRLK